MQKGEKLMHRAKDIDAKAVDRVVDETDRAREQGAGTDAGPKASR